MTQPAKDQGTEPLEEEQVASRDLMAVWFARRLTLITCVLMTAIALVAVNGTWKPSSAIARQARAHDTAFSLLGFALLAAVVALLWASFGLTRRWRGAWVTAVCVLAGWSVLLSISVADAAFRPGSVVLLAVALGPLALLSRKGTRQAVRTGAARHMPV
ncbi:MAG TPA: hypothetical protein VFV02_04200 [Acidimicrobiales bacterium]|nr:hypothetical protein [Acidimicrobiales bacterium]